ncbi:NO-inducible flavohemoprotein [Pedobacter yonginense]|uniref:Flavohemoprotein n=1 Tax=Pedobacter yonginense TaxID=651869 RepID=A0A317EJR8_9SPHI|nr:NO-inducible flavohemoprotein [Pedobacter yonginense]PWS26339.1 NO-inducible flavohemoprotein [Pedobacter yonginense]
MNSTQQSLILATVPILKEHGITLTKYFYQRMFNGNPELRNIFNLGNQHSGKQQTALALAVLAYAENIANPAVLMPVLDRIGHKHVSIDIRPEHYAIVGKHLIGSIEEVLGDAASPEILDAWAAAYGELAAIMSGHESDIYASKLQQEHGWIGWRPFTISQKKKESSEITSFYLAPADGGLVPKHQPGQYISLKVYLPELGINQIRQYSISNEPDEKHYRISVKKERNAEMNVDGMISNHLHNQMEQGDLVEITAPSGNFILPGQLNKPITFISGGVGLTPFISMVSKLVAEKHTHGITWIHGCRGREVHAFKSDIDMLANAGTSFSKYIFYNHCTPEDKLEGIMEGYLDLKTLNSVHHQTETQYFICGPGAFIEKQLQDLKAFGVPSNQIFFEEFGPSVLSAN